MKPMSAVAALGLAIGLMGATSVQAMIIIPTVTVGDAGNPNDSTGYGGVGYTYAIGKYEVNLNQYTAFLNAVAATDTYLLYNPIMGTNINAGITRSGSSGSYTYAVSGSGARPVTFVRWFDAARFANWVANGQPTGAQGNATTEDGAYTLNGATSGVGFTKNAINPNTSATTTWWIPSNDEWYKAAYYKGGSTNAGYWLFPTQSDSAPGNTIGAGTNQANYDDGDYAVTQSSSFDINQNYLTDGGAFSASGSFYGTFDQGGNVWEWIDAVIHPPQRVVRGGSWNWDWNRLRSDYYRNYDTDFYNFNLGFRVASVPASAAVPEPGQVAASVLMLLGGGAWLLWKRWKVTL